MSIVLSRSRRESLPPEEMSTEDLFALVGGSDRVREVAARSPLPDFVLQSAPELRASGLDPSVARRLACTFELTRRLATRGLMKGKPIASSREIFEAFHPRMRDLKVEQFRLVLLDAKNRVQREVLVSQGTLTSSLVHPREVFRAAIRDAAAGMVLVHNHPSGDPEPSPEDQGLTHRLEAAGEIIGIRVHDHVVVGDGRYVSFLDRGWIPA